MILAQCPSICPIAWRAALRTGCSSSEVLMAWLNSISVARRQRCPDRGWVIEVLEKLRAIVLDQSPTEKLTEDIDKLDRLGLVTDLLLLTTVGLATAGLLWWVLGPDGESSEPDVSAACTGAGCFVGTRLRF